MNLISHITIVTDDDDDDGQANGDDVTPLPSDMTSLREAIESAIVPLDEVDVSDVITKTNEIPLILTKNDFFRKTRGLLHLLTQAMTSSTAQ